MIRKLLSLFILGFSTLYGLGQNLPSLLLGKNINSTFSILAYDKESQEWGIAVATNNIYVGNSTIYIQPGLGAFSVIAETEPEYAKNGFEQLKLGEKIEQAIQYTMKRDSSSNFRQVSGIDAKGNVYAFTGASLKYWKGKSTHLLGEAYVVMGNQLNDSVLSAMSESYKKAKGTLAERLLKSLIAGQRAGGQISGKQSAALVVKGTKQDWYNQIDLRVDHSKSPFEDLQRLLNYHYGRIRINQALSMLRNGNRQHGKQLLATAIPMVEGWDGLYTKVVQAEILAGEEDKAADFIKKAMKENAEWKENLSAFFMLSGRKDLSVFFEAFRFSEKDWYNAVRGLIQINKNEEALKLAARMIQKYPASSYLYYLSGEAFLNLGDLPNARLSYMKALELDPENEEAKKALR
ncbi:DUF1028 domain-containing protein [Pedobacter nutrimenti]|jgi:uncharacterized Ntn-hydrolase superfamily protein|uniref:Putative Ntn-hydrolase superfamily protein n=1 Tax=Pedobacter nutrimenti TaxID=1241337 RepID=A0A318UEZ4_9SPHI|nr:DUF1028 domain-containing protein [Pedobacter nutrimenti]PYF70047.1 putative Ntn-hydrolase superfamily protein [Pedobacter nutrimenti]